MITVDSLIEKLKGKSLAELNSIDEQLCHCSWVSTLSDESLPNNLIEAIDLVDCYVSAMLEACNEVIDAKEHAEEEGDE